MTLIGKILVFFVLILALVWNALVVNAYATRTNWKAQADAYKSKAAEAADAANNLRKLVEAEREASEDKARVLREDRDRLYEQLQSQKKGYDEVNKAYQERQVAERTNVVQANQLQANVSTLQKQVKDLTDLQAVKEKKIDDLTLESERSKADMVKAQLDAAAQQRRAEQLYENVLKVREQLDELRRGGTGTALDKRVSAPGGFRGTVRTRSGELVSFTPGLDAGLQVGAVLTVRRFAPAPKYVGKVRVVSVDPKEGVGRFEAPAGTRLAPGDYPQAGDELVPD